jgi:hypothetical protein
MDFPVVLVLWVIWAALRGLWNAMSSGGSSSAGTSSPSAPKIPRQPGRPSSVLSVSLSHRPYVREVSATLSGNLALRGSQVAHGAAPLTLLGIIVDVTSGNEEDVLSLSPEHRGEGMSLTFVDKVVVNAPGAWGATDFVRVELPPRPVFSLPIDKMVPPQAGKRRLVAKVAVFEGEELDEDKVLAVAHSDPLEVLYDSGPGYLNAASHALDVEAALAQIAVLAAYSAGEPDKRGLLRSLAELLSKRYSPASDWYGNSLDQEGLTADAAKERAGAALRGTAARMSSGPQSSASMLEGACRTLSCSFLPGVAQDAYELAVKVVVSDGKIEPKEERFLKIVARKLELDDKLVQKMKDLHMPLSMRTGKIDAAALGMPENLSQREQRAWLSSEYEKWRNRASNMDADAAKNAEAHMAALAKARAELDSK